jgi:3-deoxy-D-manno-octulosonic-acid transferase
MATSGKYRHGLVEKLGFVEPRSGDGCLWIHGVSVGEVLSARAIIPGLEREFPGREVVISTTTDAAQGIAAKTYEGRRVFYWPLDFSRAVARAFRRVKPALVVLMELEVWPNFMRRAHREGVPVVVANGRITERSVRRFGLAPGLAARLLNGVDLYLVQAPVYRERLLSLGVEPSRVEVTGNVKFDTLATDLDPAGAARMRREMGVADEEAFIIGGSTHPGEETALLDAYASLKGRGARVRLAIVPRHKERFEEAAGLIRARGYTLLRRSTLAEGAAPEGEVILGDRMGELAALYEAADVAFVGGTLAPIGGHNVAEPAAKGKPVVFGPSLANVPDAAPLLLDAGAATRVESAAALADAFALYLDAGAGARAGSAGRNAVAASKGAAERTVRRIRQVFDESIMGSLR